MNYSQEYNNITQPTGADQAVSSLGQIGSKIPVYGTIISAGAGLYGMMRKDQNAAKLKRLNEKRDQANREQSFRNALQTFPTTGIGTPSLYMGKGGKLGSTSLKYKAEGEEVLLHNPNDPIVTDKAGDVKPIANGISKFTGDKHSAPSGGIGVTQNDGGFVFSDQVPLPDDVKTLLKKAKLW